jgi:hypothetical protein
MADVEKLHGLGKEVGEAIYALKDGLDMGDLKEVVDVGTTAVACASDIGENEMAAGMNIAAGLLDYFAVKFREAAAAAAAAGGGG